ncbi:hypothetical protein D2E24_0695 [Bifidobacterium samirii]|uniref:VanZ-like domain-containing protein n=2 Tax=Bifidobacterium samirii TaxID=2306974 RepID=A0A430FV13_9BIFI|nr:hypothetical protein D2E24_0695 [Bifidobacterium samirii]
MLCMVLKSWNNVTAWGINLDIAGFLDELMAGSITPVLNIVLLIPVGFFLASCRGARFAVIIGVSGSILVESLEFVFHLGVLDVLDICTNVMGVLIGIGCLSAMRWMGFRRVDIDGGHFYLVRRHDSSAI